MANGWLNCIRQSRWLKAKSIDPKQIRSLLAHSIVVNRPPQIELLKRSAYRQHAPFVAQQASTPIDR
jgi:hypothetical protein